MCGIAGYVGRGDKKTLMTMLNATHHRGPDDQGIFIDGEVGLGSNRLSIIDLSENGKQPMFDGSKSVYIVFNGEIYNFLNLRKQLEGKYKFKSKTDTEVLLYAYKEWGISCLNKINGMFSFVIYDKQNNLLFGARDRLGEKPLKYYFDGNLFAFASEIKGLLPILKSKQELDPIAINHYLTLQYVPAPYTGFKNIFKLPPGHFFIFKNGPLREARKLQIKKYWSVSFSKKLSLSKEEWEEILLEKLKESVRARLIADVPVGAFLSGGIDSSAIVALMTQVTSQRIKTFNISFDDPNFDESKYASLVSKQYKTDHKTFRVTNKMMADVFTKLADYYDEPFADNSVIPTLALCKFASKYVKVALTGDGGDENFAGYDRYNIVSFADMYRQVPKLARDILSTCARKANSVCSTRFTDRLCRYTKTFNQPFYRKYPQYSSFFDNETKFGLYSTEFRNKVAESDTFGLFKQVYNPNISDLDNALNIDISTYLPEDLLFKTDIASMAYSLETRAPFLNHELLELTAQMPHQLKIKFFNKKYIFKKILKNNHLVPNEILNRPKRGFVAPIDKWLKEDYKDLVIETLLSKKFKNADIFNHNKLEMYLQDYFRGKGISSNNIFALLSLSSWFNKYWRKQ